MQAVPKPSFKRRVPKRVDRGKFDRKTRHEIMLRDNGFCRNCGNFGGEIHHVQFKSSGGRGVHSNGLTLCHACHREVHANRKIADYWRVRFAEIYGPNYFKDAWD